MVKNSVTLDKYEDIDTFVFDKTGTITVSKPYIQEVLHFMNILMKKFLELERV